MTASGHFVMRLLAVFAFIWVFKTTNDFIDISVKVVYFNRDQVILELYYVENLLRTFLISASAMCCHLKTQVREFRN